MQTVRSQQRYQKGSNSLPVEERGPANHRHFARCVAKLKNVTVSCFGHAVYLTDHRYDGDTTVYDAAVHYDMVETECPGEERRYVHVDLLEEQ